MFDCGIKPEPGAGGLGCFDNLPPFLRNVAFKLLLPAGIVAQLFKALFLSGGFFSIHHAKLMECVQPSQCDVDRCVRKIKPFRERSAAHGSVLVWQLIHPPFPQSSRQPMYRWQRLRITLPPL